MMSGKLHVYGTIFSLQGILWRSFMTLCTFGGRYLVLVPTRSIHSPKTYLPNSFLFPIIPNASEAELKFTGIHGTHKIHDIFSFNHFQHFLQIKQRNSTVISDTYSTNPLIREFMSEFLLVVHITIVGGDRVDEDTILKCN